MTSLVTEIPTLAKIAKASCPPNQWRITESIDASFHLEFSFDSASQSKDNPEFTFVTNRSGKARIYKTLKSIFKDIKKVQQDSLVHFLGAQIG